MPTTIRFTCPILIGRQEERGFLRQRLDFSSAGSGSTVVLGGEAGLGKSRLVEDLAAYAGEHRMEALVGRCFELDQGIAFAPFTDLLMTYLRDHGAENAHDIVPDLALIAPDIQLDGDDSRQHAIYDDRFRHERVLRALGRFLVRLADERPILLVIEDLHWVDDASLAALNSLARRIESLPVMMILTCRMDEAPARVRHTLAALHRAGLATNMELEPLTTSDAMAFVKAIFDLDQGPGSAFVHALHALTGGNPFFMEEIIGALVSSGDIFQSDGVWERKALDVLTIPRSIQDAVVMMLEHVTPHARDVLEIAAILGQSFDIPLMLDLVGGDELEVLESLRELVDASLIVEESADDFQFRHALIRQAVEASMLRRKRRAVHRTAMEMIIAKAGRQASATRAGEIARHAHPAEAWAEALSYASEAGSMALSAGTPHAAIVHFDRALDAAEQLAVGPPWKVVHGRAKALDTIGDFDAAHADYERAERIGRVNCSVRDEWEAALDLGFLWCSRDYARARPLLDHALEIARSRGDDVLVAYSLNRIGNWLVNANDPEAGLRHHLEARDIFQSTGDRRGEAQTLDMASMAYTIGGDLVTASNLNRQVVSLYRELGDRIGEAGNHGPDMPNVFHGIVPFVGSGTMNGMRRHAARAVALASEANWISGEAYATSVLGASLLAGGNLGEGLQAARRAHDLALSIDHQEWSVFTAWVAGVLLMDVGQFGEASSRLEQARRSAYDIHGQNWIANTTAGLAIALVRQGELARAADILGTAEDTLRMITQGERSHWLARAELYLAKGRFEESIDIVDRLYATAKNLSNEGDVPVLVLVKTSIFLQTGRPEHALPLLDAAIGVACTEGAKTTESRLRVLRVTALHALGRRDDARQERDTAARLIREMAETLPEDEREAYPAWALEPLPAGYREQHKTPYAGMLTRREREVSRLVATGLTNREIGEKLFIAERTVESHVAAIMRKLGFSARTQIAAWTVEQDHQGT